MSGYIIHITKNKLDVVYEDSSTMFPNLKEYTFRIQPNVIVRYPCIINLKKLLKINDEAITLNLLRIFSYQTIFEIISDRKYSPIYKIRDHNTDAQFFKNNGVLITFSVNTSL